MFDTIGAQDFRALSSALAKFDAYPIGLLAVLQYCQQSLIFSQATWETTERAEPLRRRCPLAKPNVQKGRYCAFPKEVIRIVRYSTKQ
jgi:hypothetical protein